MEELYEKNKLIISYMIDKYQDNQLFISLLDILDTQYSKKSLSGLKKVDAEINDWVNTLSSEDLKVINSLTNHEDLIDRTISSGTINSDEDFYLLEKKVCELIEDNKETHLIDTINRLLTKYHLSK
ncbi:MAG: hypothetical protein HRT68_13160 [Flavobacteriaceae bacterium]|nr:hypothetical protein [Flavobacteriaceae bacterium]